MSISNNDITVLRQLGERYMNYASLAAQKEKMGMWKALNRGQMHRPMVVIDQLPWNELEETFADELRLQVADPYWRNIERELRQTIYKWENIPADMVLEPFILIPAVIYSEGYGLAVERETLATFENETASSHSYTNTIRDEGNIAKIKDMEFTADSEKNALYIEEAEHIFGGIAPVRMSHGVDLSLGVWDRLSEFMGVENIYFDLIDRPEFIHAVMRRITDATIAGIKSANKQNIVNDISNRCHCSYVYTDEFLPDFGDGLGAVSQNSWAFGLAQLFTSVSNDVFEEFEMPYITEMASYFGNIYYGCCDRLDHRLDIAEKIPNVRKISCSPWSDRDAFAEKLGKGLVMSNKPTPAFLSTDTFDAELVKNDTLHTCEAAKRHNGNLEILLKDVSTVRFQPERLRQWHDVVMGVVGGF